MIVCATLLCDLKRNSQHIGPPAMLALDGDCRFYINLETGERNGERWTPLRYLLQASGRPYDIDTWSRDSTWAKRSQRDQDSTRLEPICVARNMAMSFAIASGASHLFFVDADVVVDPYTLQRLLAHNVPLISALVPGRGAHNHAEYVFGERWRKGDLLSCAHATLGCTLIRRDAFVCTPFRWGAHPIHRDVSLSEDPCFGADLEVHQGIEWLVDTSIRVQHLDDPVRPLTMSEADNSYLKVVGR